MIHTCRRLYTEKEESVKITTAERQDLSRRFAICYKLLLEKFKAEKEPPKEYTLLKERVLNYQNEVSELVMTPTKFKSLLKI